MEEYAHPLLVLPTVIARVRSNHVSRDVHAAAEAWEHSAAASLAGLSPDARADVRHVVQGQLAVMLQCVHMDSVARMSEVSAVLHTGNVRIQFILQVQPGSHDVTNRTAPVTITPASMDHAHALRPAPAASQPYKQ